MNPSIPNVQSSLVTPEVIKRILEMFRTLKLNESWRGKIPTQEGFTKEDKEAFNLLVFAVLESIMLDDEDDLSAFPAYVIRRLFIKAATWDSKPENKEFFHDHVVDFDEEIQDYALGKMENEGTKEFISYIDAEASKLSAKVGRVYKAARSLATLIEYEEMNAALRPDTVLATKERINNDLCQYEDLPHFLSIAMGIGKYGKIKDLLRAMSWSRYTFRWQGYFAPIKCSFLAHMLESSVIAYLMGLEIGRETDAIKDFESALLHDRNFWVLLFHDIAEIWTDDIPSPIKSMMFRKLNPELAKKLGQDTCTLRELTQMLELKALEEHFYSCLTPEITAFFQKGIMLEDVQDKNAKYFY